MTLDKAIEHGKEKREPYRGKRGKAVDGQCRNRGTCSACEKKRRLKELKHTLRFKEEMEEVKNG